jgi:hypothetical protein
MEIRPSAFHSIQNSAQVEKKQKKKSQSLFSENLEDSTEIYPVQASSFVLSVDPLFANLEQPSNKSAAVQAGLNLLDELDRLRANILNSETYDESLQTLLRIKEGVQNIPRDHIDTRLKEILLEVETRAVVELAKAGR